METTKQEHKIHFNWVDVIIILLVIAVLGVVILLRNRSAGIVETTPISYEVEFTKVPEAVADLLSEGTAVFEATDSTPLGTVDSVRVTPHTEYQYVQALGEYRKVESAQYDVFVRVNADAVITAESTTVSDNPVGVGSEISMKTQGMGATGFVVALEEEAKPQEPAIAGERAITYRASVENVRMMTAGQFHVGDYLFGEDDSACLGKITAIDVQTHQVSTVNANGEQISVTVPERYDISLTLEGKATEKEYGYFLDGATELKVGAEISVCNTFLVTTVKYTAIDRID